MEKAADIYESLYRGQQIDDNDIYIAAIAIVNGCVLVTDNEKHFSRIPGLQYVIGENRHNQNHPLNGWFDQAL